MSENSSEVFVYTMNKAQSLGAWSRYVFPFRIHYEAQLGNDVYVRDGRVVRKLESGKLYDEVLGDHDVIERVPFDGVIEWNFLDLGAPGRTKMLNALDITGDGEVEISILYNQANRSAVAGPLRLPADTVPGQRVSFPIMSPSMAPRITYPGNSEDEGTWEFYGMNLYLRNMGSAA